MKQSLPRGLRNAILFLVFGAVALMVIAHIADPPGRCEDRGGTWVVAGRYCEEANTPDQRTGYLADF